MEINYKIFLTNYNKIIVNNKTRQIYQNSISISIIQVIIHNFQSKIKTNNYKTEKINQIQSQKLIMILTAHL